MGAISQTQHYFWQKEGAGGLLPILGNRSLDPAILHLEFILANN